MSSASKSVQFVGESVGEGKEAFEATLRRSGLNPLIQESNPRWSLHQAARRLLDESSKEDEWEEGSSQGEGDPKPGGNKVPLGTIGSLLLGSDWVPRPLG
ncbi:UNVERIFIED_CONTAM: hypothetical protein Sangu_1181700 [Sesamum angustifolium]|uniref:Uncharacterized protein n=1 Tax=Sesamum angustifolium TaxID=2727405 RepID=A0AAW2NI12_9LAMI